MLGIATFLPLSMETSPNFYDYHQFDNDNQPQVNSIYNGLYESRMPKDWIFENEFCLRLDSLNVNRSHQIPVFEPANNDSQSSLTTYFASSQPGSHIPLTDAEHNHSSSIWSSNEAPETSDQHSASNVIPLRKEFCTEIQTTAFVLPCHARPPPVSSATFHPMCKEHARDLVYAHQGFESSLTGEIEENLFSNVVLWNRTTILPQQINNTTPSQSPSRIKPKSREHKFYCNLSPCNHQKAFKRKSDLKRHLVTQHSEHRLSQCPWPGCERKGANGFARRDKMLQHQDKVHGWRKWWCRKFGCYWENEFFCYMDTDRAEGTCSFGKKKSISYVTELKLSWLQSVSTALVVLVYFSFLLLRTCC